MRVVGKIVGLEKSFRSRKEPFEDGKIKMNLVTLVLVVKNSEVGKKTVYVDKKKSEVRNNRKERIVVLHRVVK